FGVVQGLFDELERAAGRLRRLSPKEKLTISALPTIASVWLMPRLHRFTGRNPGIEVRIVSSIEPADLVQNEADIAIRVGRLPGRHYERNRPRIELNMVTRWDGVRADELFADRLRPVCAPGFLRNLPLPAAELVRHPLIHTTTRRHGWPDWLRAQGVKLA